MRTIPHWIAGSETTGASTRYGPVYNPATGAQQAQVALTGHSFFPNLISQPFSNGLDTAFGFAIVACLIAAGASLLRGGKYEHTEATEEAAAAEGRPRRAERVPQLEERHAS